MKTLVTGATGFLGSHLVEALVGRGEEVRALVRPTSQVERLRALDVELVQGDLADAGSLPAAVAGVGRIFHCAALVGDWGSWDDFRRTNVQGVRNLLEAASRTDLSRFVHVSTTDVYGYPGGTGCDESHPYRKRGFPYGDTKIEGEQEVWRYHREKGLPVTVVRPVNIYGPRSKTFVLEFVEVLKDGYMLYVDGGRHVAGLCYVDNLAQAMILAGERPESIGQAYNVSDGSDVTWRQYVTALAAILGVKPFNVSLPHGLIYAVAGVMEAVAGLIRTENRPLLTRTAVELLGTDQNFPIDKARRELGYEPQVGFEEGMDRVAAWLRAEGYIPS